MDRLQPVRDPKTIATVAQLHAICFGDNYFENFIEKPDDLGDMYALWENNALIGYAVYGQVWLPVHPYAYISSIGIHPEYQQQGWGLKILNAILTELSSRPNCPAVHTDIRQSNIASQRLFKKAGFCVYCEHDIPYGDEVGIRVVKYFKPNIE